MPLGSSKSLIVDTVARARRMVPPDRVRILTRPGLAGALRRSLGGLGEGSLMVEPEAKGTLPALVWAAWEISKRHRDAVMISLHADHVIRPESRFVEQLQVIGRLARHRDLLFSVAIPPTRPETGYGYIERGAPIEDGGDSGAFHVASFREKPDVDTAREYVSAGHLWNSGIFVWKASTFLREVQAVTPELAELVPLLNEGRVDAFFVRAPAMSVDVGVLERSGRVASVAATFEWDDVGSWEALMRSHEPDEKGNVLIGAGHLVESERNIVYSPAGTVVAYGVDDLVIVRSGDVTLVTRRELAPSLKDLLDRLPAELREDAGVLGALGPERAEGLGPIDPADAPPSPDEAV